MVQKNQPKRRQGRPRAYDPETALGSAMSAFWDAGYAATSLDVLSGATGMKRPSLYGAFGDKQALYLKTLARYWDTGRIVLRDALAPHRPLPDGLRAAYAAALALYFSGEQGARGCFLIGTATTESVGNPDVRAFLAGALQEIDQAFEARFQLAREHGELDRGADPKTLAKLASAVLHSLAIRSRAGEPRAALSAMATASVRFICGGTARSPR